jgi:hypothetical protein
MLWYIKQLLPLTYWTTYTETESGKKFFVIWRMWFGRSFDIIKFETGG